MAQKDELKGRLYWITGLSGAGKTTIGNALYYKLRKRYDNIVLLDGDILKNVVGEKLGYSYEDRKERAFRYSKMCKMLTDQGIIVICCTIAMFNEIRAWNRKNIDNYVEVFLEVPISVLQKRDRKGMYSKYKDGKMENLAGVDLRVEFPENADIIINNDGTISIQECVQKVLDYSVKLQNDVAYWNNYYENKKAVDEPTLFAQFVVKYEKEMAGKKLLDLGCGNGRDSIYFASKDMEVTGVDLSRKAIGRLNRRFSREKNLHFICDDFVKAKTIFQQQYDFCYSRFTIHAIRHEKQQELLDNVGGALKEKGRFFIEVRSVNDDIFGKGIKVERNAYLYDDHYRRFVVREELEEELKEKQFKIIFSEEQRGFAPFGEANPPIIRIIAEKQT